MTNEASAPPTAATAGSDGDAAEWFYTPAEAADLLRIKESWLRRKAGRREIPCRKIGKHLRFSASDLAAVVATAAQPSSAQQPTL